MFEVDLIEEGHEDPLLSGLVLQHDYLGKVGGGCRRDGGREGVGGQDYQDTRDALSIALSNNDMVLR